MIGVVWPALVLAGLGMALSLGVVAFSIVQRRSARATVETLPPKLNGRGKIRLTFISNNTCSDAVEFDTDDLGEALAEYGRRHFSGGPPNSGPDAWIVAFVVENGEARMDRRQRSAKFDDLASIERFRSTREPA